MVDWLDFHDPKLGLYEICFPSEYVEAITKDISKQLHLTFDSERLNQKLNNIGNSGLDCLYISQNSEERALLLLDCSNTDWIYTLCIIYDETVHSQVKDRLLAWDCHCREEYGQPRPAGYQLRNKIQDEEPLFVQIIHKHRLVEN
ncbi:hypothetical protein [Thermoflavimicrobium daqui]|jgi:hypothetical protein|uniref:Uncharacterized protein n=1 Tax=Thermoflavimicrobium daqui TaxID=2137476 RepID=A0A364K8T7_9BACL|nr:hypothetical protein [Thermoflavimicrobium daqui]RAL26715.1 hypothetical protein DL897_01295 [Thermoflavimicrobium daqui]